MKPELVSQLRDIHGLDAVSPWPPAAGWWLSLVLALLVAFWLTRALRRLRHYPPGSWRHDAWKQLRTLDSLVYKQPPARTAAELSQLLRRIAIARLGREHAAGLSGQAWLDWLEQHDPGHFAWSEQGRPLLTLPYAPALRQPGDRRQLAVLIKAALRWTERHRGSGNV